MSGRGRARTVLVALVAVFALVGCGSTAKHVTASGIGADAGAAWATAQLTDVDGQRFAIKDLVGKTVVVENFATWCSECLHQLGDTQKAAAAAGDTAGRNTGFTTGAAPGALGSFGTARAVGAVRRAHALDPPRLPFRSKGRVHR